MEAAELLEQKNNVTLAGICTSTPEQRPEELLTLHSLCRKISGAVKLGLDWSKPKFLMVLFGISIGFIYIFPHEYQLVVSVSSCPDIHMPGFAQHRGDHIQVNAGLPALERAGKSPFPGDGFFPHCWGCVCELPGSSCPISQAAGIQK